MIFNLISLAVCLLALVGFYWYVKIAISFGRSLESKAFKARNFQPMPARMRRRIWLQAFTWPIDFFSLMWKKNG